MTDQGWRWDRLVLVALLGASAGAVNGWLCLAGIPEPVHDNPTFRWVIVPGGAIHGAVLVLIPVVAAATLAAWRLTFRVLMAPLVGWIAGYASWIPLHHWAIDETWLKSVVWPWSQGGGWTAAAWLPFPHFGLVAVIYFLALVVQGSRRGPVLTAAAVVCAGVLGSLWWWIEFEPWYFAAIHGTVWGLLVGWGTSKIGGLRELGVA